MNSRLHVHLLSAELRRLCVEGELDLETCDELASAIAELGTNGDVSVDMSGLTFIDSSGLNLLLGVDREHREAGTRFVIVDPSPPAQRLLSMTATDSLFFIEKS
jgi:anti-sigma B factor antagonist